MSALNSFYSSPSTTSLSSIQGFRRVGLKPSLKKTLQSYKSLKNRLESKLEQLIVKRDKLNRHAFVVLEDVSSPQHKQSVSNLDRPSSERAGSEMVPVIEVITASQPPNGTGEMPIQLEENSVQISNGHVTPSPKGLVEQGDTYHSDVTSLIATANKILIEYLQIKLSFVSEAIDKLTSLYSEYPKIEIPQELSFSRYEEWLASNQRLLELNAQLYDIERLKFEFKQKQVVSKKVLKKSTESAAAGGRFLNSSVQRIQAFMSRFTFESPIQNRTQAYLQELIDPTRDRMTLEAQKIKEFVAVCFENIDTPTERAVGAHPQSYQEFMDILCHYIVERQQELQGEDLSYALVYSTVERHLIPRILPAILRHVTTTDRDNIMSKQCERYSEVTLKQLKIKDELQSDELIPFVEAITQLRVSYFSTTPTDKMYAIVAAAKGIYEQLAVMGESSIDGDSFLDLWVYVILKANVKDLATNLQFMAEYGNPMLALDEAGYYLTSLEAAVAFIESLEPEQLLSDRHTDFVVCECSKFESLSQLTSSCFQLVADRVQLRGYKVAVILDWALNRTKFFRTTLLCTGDDRDVAIVSVIRFSMEWSLMNHVTYFTDLLTHPERAMNGLRSMTTPLGLAIIADSANIDPQGVLVLPTGDFDCDSVRLNHILQLIQLGSECREEVNLLDIPSPHPSECINGESVIDHTPQPSTLQRLLLGKQRPRQQSNTERIPSRRSIARHRDDRRTASFNEKYSGHPPSPLSTSCLLEVEPNIHVSLDNMAASAAQPPKHSSRYSWLSRKKRDVTDDWSSHGDVHGRYFRTSDRGDSLENSPVHAHTRRVEVEVHSEDEGYRNKLFSLDSTLRNEQRTGDPVMQRPVSIQTPSDPDSSKVFANELATSATPSVICNYGDELTVSRAGMVQSGTSSRVSCLLADNPFLASSEMFFSAEHVRMLECNFRKNHNIADSAIPAQQAVEVIIKQGQVYLQRLDFLSVCYCIDGVYSAMTVNAVRRFQVAHNTHVSSRKLRLPENGHLTAATFQYLQQTFITTYANMLKLGLNRFLGLTFDPTSTADEDIRVFREGLQSFKTERERERDRVR